MNEKSPDPTEAKESGTPFQREVLQVALPVTAQATIISLLSLTDQVMVGQLGETAVSAVGIVSKITSILTVMLTGIATATSVFCAQFWGNGQRAQIHQVFGIALRFSMTVTILMLLAALGWPHLLISVFTTDGSVLAAGGAFLRIIAIGYVPTTLTLLYAAVLRSAKLVKLAMYAGISSVILNVVLDYLLIFGSFGAPRLGLQGAALATTIARFTELGIIVVVSYYTRNIAAVTRWSDTYCSEPGLRKRFLLVALPLSVNELLWILGESAYAAVYGRMGTGSLAAMSMTFPLQGLSIGFMSGLSTAAAVLIGQRLGRSDFVEAKSYGKRLTGLGIGLSVVIGALLAFGAPYYAKLYALSAEVQHSGVLCLFVFSGFMWVKVANMILCGAVLNSGGDSRFVLIMESSATWLLGVPLAIVGAFVLELPVAWVYFLLSLEEVVRLIAGFWRFRSGRWARNLVGTANDAAATGKPSLELSE